MAFTSTMIFSLDAAGNNINNGGAFNPGNPNMSTDLTATSGNTSSPVVTSASYTFLSRDIGHWLYIQGGTNWISGWYLIASVSAGAATITAGIGTASIQSDQITFGTNTTAGVATVASPTGGTWSIDYSQNPNLLSSGSDLVSTNGTTSAPSVTSALIGSFDVNYIGNVINVILGTNWVISRYEIVSVSGGAATLDKACRTVDDANQGVWDFGGAYPMGSGESAFFNLAVAGNMFFIKSGSYTQSQTVSIAAAGAGSGGNPVRMMGFKTMRGDTTNGTDRPTISLGASLFTAAARWWVLNLQFSGTGTRCLAIGSAGVVKNCKIINKSTTASRAAYLSSGTSNLYNCELVSYRGRGADCSGSITNLVGCYIHDCDVAIQQNAGALLVLNCLIENNVTVGINNTTTVTSNIQIIYGNTFVGGVSSPTGDAIQIAANSSSISIRNNIIYGFVNGINQRTSQNNELNSNNNCLFNNTTNYVNVLQGTADQLVDPQFVSVGQITGTAGKYAVSNNVLIDTSKNFLALGVVAGRDTVYIKSGSGVTAGIYGISGITTTTNPNDTLFLDIPPGTNTTADKVYQIGIGHNMAIGLNLKATGFPGTFQASLSTGYADIGAVQRQEPIGSLIGRGLIV